MTACKRALGCAGELSPLAALLWSSLLLLLL
jgi:hypothetical protein